ncbi:MAG: DNA-binding MurR/RpiR family transcriptional regulator [Polaribacter sp.]|jgi:DNA-binding MurR/RpiR family transcriptional regulator
MKLNPNFKKLRELIILIENGDTNVDIGIKSLNCLKAMLDEPESVCTNNIVELSEIYQVSPASITRLTKSLGFNSFVSFQKVFKERSKIRDNYFSQKLLKLSTEKNLTAKQIMQKQLQSTAENMIECIKSTDDNTFENAADLLADSNRIFVFGHKQASAMANIIRYGLCLIRGQVNTLGQYEHGLAIALGQVKANDLLVIFSSAPYSNLTVDICAMANKIGCKILAITDSTMSPLNQHATISIKIPTTGQYFTNSLSANCIFIESLLCFVAIKIGQSAVKKLQSHEELLTQLNANS